MNLSKSCVPLGIRPSPSASVIISSFDQPVALGVDRISSPPGASRSRERRRRTPPGRRHARSPPCEVTRSNWPSSSSTVAGAIVDLEPLPPRHARARPRSASGAASIAGDLRAQPRQRLGQQPGAAADVERASCPSSGRRLHSSHLPMLVDLVADIFEPHRVELVQHRRRRRSGPTSRRRACRTARPRRARCLSRPCAAS